MEAISACYRTATAPGSTSPVSAADAAACIVKFIDANRHKLLTGKAISEDGYKEGIGVRRDQCPP